MTNRATFRIIAGICLLYASLFFVSAADAITENECINGGGSVSEGSGCKFCVGGKYDLSEIKDVGKTGKTDTGPNRQMHNASSSKVGSGTVNKSPADNRM